MEVIIYEKVKENEKLNFDDFNDYVKKELQGEKMLKCSSTILRGIESVAYFLTPYSIGLSVHCHANETISVELFGNKENIGEVEEIILKEFKK